jgi:hypothetical protein
VVASIGENESIARPPGLTDVQDEQRRQHDQRPGHDVEHEMVGRRHDGERHRDRHQDGERPQRPVRARAEDDDADEQVPADVEAGHGGVLVDKRRGEQLAIAGRTARHDVDERKIGEARRRDREQREDDEPHEAGDQAGVAEQVVLAPAIPEQQNARDHQHRPVAVDVDAGGEVGEGMRADHGALDRVLPADAEGTLDVHHPGGIRERVGHAALGQRAHAEVGQVGQREQSKLASAGGQAARANGGG